MNEDLLARIESLEKRVSLLFEAIPGQLRETGERIAVSETVLFILLELAERQGVSPKRFTEHFKEMFAFHREQRVLQTGDTNPSLANAMDIRLPGAEPIEGFPSLLFPEKEG